MPAASAKCENRSSGAVPRVGRLRFVSLSKKSVSRAAPVHTAGQRLPLEGKLAAQPTDEVASKNWEKAETSIKKQDFHLIRPVCALDTFPSRGRLVNAFSFLAFCFFDSFKKRRKAKPSFFFIAFALTLLTLQAFISRFPFSSGSQAMRRWPSGSGWPERPRDRCCCCRRCREKWCRYW